MKTRVLVVDDEPAILTLLERQLSEQHDVRGAASAEEGLSLLQDAPADVLITDLRLPGMDGVALVRRIGRLHPGLPVIGTSGDACLPELAELVRMGIADFLVKPFSTEEARLAVARALALRALRAATPAPAGPHESLAGLVGEGLLMRGLREEAARAAAASAPLLIEGPSGSGKTMLARGIQAASPRADEPLVELACAAMPASLLESELFGHSVGAFTGATRDRPGAFERARQGTLLLDEVTALTPDAQVRVVHVLATGQTTRLGEDRPRPIEARILATTQRALEPLVRDGGFREDLFHALAVLRIRTPSLCELPPDDVERIASLLLDRVCSRLGAQRPVLEPSFLEAAAGHPWPGNVRELENALERAVLLGDGGPVTGADLAIDGSAWTSRVAIPERGLDLASTLGSIERDYLQRALERTGGNRERAAALLGLARTGLVQKLKRMGDPP